MIQSGFDIKYKEIPLWFSILGGVIGIGFCIVERRAFLSLLFACLPGLLVLGFARITKEIMGYGDGIVLLIMGVYLPVSNLASISLLAFFVAGAVALVLLVLFRKKGNYRMPFVPFLGFAYGLDCLVRWGEF